MGLSAATRKKTRSIAWSLLSLVFVAYFLIALLSSSGRSIGVRDIFYETLGFLTVITLIVTAVLLGKKDRRLWTFVAASGVFWMLGDITYRGAEILNVAGTSRTLSPPDLFYVLSYASLICVVQTFAMLSIKPKINRFHWAKLYALGVTVLSFGISIILAFALPNGIGNIGSMDPPQTISMIIHYIYPALDIGILSGLLLIILTHDVPFRKAWQGLGIFGLALFTLADINYSLAEPAGIYSPENLVSRLIIAMWILGDILILMAAIYRITETSERSSVSSEITDNSLFVAD